MSRYFNPYIQKTASIDSNKQVRDSYLSENDPVKRSELRSQYNTKAGMDYYNKKNTPWHSKYNWNMQDWFGNVDWSKPDTYVPRFLTSLLGMGIIGGLTRNNWAAIGSLPVFWGLGGGLQKNWDNIKQDTSTLFK